MDGSVIQDRVNLGCGSRMETGASDCGEGWTFRGDTALQTTGHAGYASLARAIAWTGRLEALADHVRTPENACQSAAVYSLYAGGNAAADRADIASGHHRTTC